MKPLLITIDGPAGAGKTTVSRMLAERLTYRYIDTGALYRVVAYEAKTAGIKPDDDAGLEHLCKNLKIAFIRNADKVYIESNGVDVTDKIRTPEISMLASIVSARPVVRKYLLDVQREMGKEKCAIFEGRDMGTVIFPDADIKFYLDASLTVRSQRRFNEIGSKTSLEAVEKDIKRRDENDSNRAIAPLKPAQNAIIIDSTYLSTESVVEQMLDYIKTII